MRLDDRRPLNEAERRIMAALLAPEFPGVGELRALVSHTLVLGRCDCGCPTVELLVPPDAPSSIATTHARLAPVEGHVTPIADEPRGDIILFLDDGRMTCLECVSHDDPPPSEWPTLDRLTVTRID
jgi:hypothetical protein